jgi:hypothetical protein
VSERSLADRIFARIARPVLEVLQGQSKRLARQEKMIEALQTKVRTLSTDLHRLQEDMGSLRSATDEVRRTIGRRGLGGQARRIGSDVRALLRRELLEPDLLPFPQRLFASRANISSQYEEDGILLALIAEAGIKDARFLDIGSGTGGGVTAMLAQECGWSGLMVDGNEDHVKMAQPRFPAGRIAVVHSFVTRENVNALVESHGLTGDIGVFSLDIDGNDYWIWEALEACSPRIAAVEYNAFFGLDRAVTLPYMASFSRKGLPSLVRKNYFGASLPAFVRLGRRKGYRLVTTDGSGLNAFFVRNDVAPHIPECPIDQLPFRDTDIGKYANIFEMVASHNLPLVEVE